MMLSLALLYCEHKASAKPIGLILLLFAQKTVFTTQNKNTQSYLEILICPVLVVLENRVVGPIWEPNLKI